MNYLRKITTEKFAANDIIFNHHNPAWGEFRVIETGDHYVIRSDRGERVLFETEADEAWSLAS